LTRGGDFTASDACLSAARALARLAVALALAFSTVFCSETAMSLLADRFRA
jgi:hypothetical protein